MKITDYGTWYKFVFQYRPTKPEHVIWTRNERLLEDPELIKKIKSIGYTQVYCDPCVHGEWTALDAEDDALLL